MKVSCHTALFKKCLVFYKASFLKDKSSVLEESPTWQASSECMNRAFQSCIVPLKMSPVIQNLSFENEFDLHQNEPAGGTQFLSHEWFCSKTQIDEEVKVNSEVAYHQKVVLF